MARTYGRTREDAARIARVVRTVEGMPVGSFAPRRGPRADGGGGDVTITWGEVQSSTAAFDRRGSLPGEVVALPWIDVPLWSVDNSYLKGDVVRLPTPDAFDSTASYANEDLVLEAGIVYQADGSVSAGAFDAADWVAMGGPGDNFVAVQNLSDGEWQPLHWLPTDATQTRSKGSTVTLSHYHTQPPPVGSTVAWSGTEVIGRINRVRRGRVDSFTIASVSLDGDAIRLGDVDVWEFLPVDEVAEHRDSVTYSAGAFVRFDDDLYRCNTSHNAKAFDAGDWDAVSITVDEVIDRTRPSITVPHRFAVEPEEGSLIEWDDYGVRVLTCSSPADWVT